MPTTDVEDLIKLIHASSIQEDGWTTIGNAVCLALNAHGAALARPSNVVTCPSWCHLFEFEPQFIAEYAERWGSRDVWFRGALEKGRALPGVVSVGEELVDDREYRASAFYNELLRPMRIDRMVNTTLTGPEPDGSYGPTAFSFYRGPGAAAFSANDTALLARLTPHLAIAARNHWAAQSLRFTAALRSEMLDTVASAIICLDNTGCVQYTNYAAEQIIQQGRWIQVCQKLLVAARGVANSEAVASALQQLRAGIGFRLILTNSGSDAIFCGNPLPAANGFLPGPGVEKSAILWLTPIQGSADVADDIRSLYHLTRAEHRLLRVLLCGKELHVAAEQLQISVHTARTQLKTIFSKTGLHSQSSLMRLAARLSTMRRGDLQE
jgi:DNA-binding CsgD family transcriptional regulator